MHGALRICRIRPIQIEQENYQIWISLWCHEWKSPAALVTIILSFLTITVSTPIVYSIMQAIPPALFFVVPVFSVILLYIRLSPQSTASTKPESCDTLSRPLIACFAYVSFGILSVIAGSLGIAASTLSEHPGVRYVNLEAGGHIVVALIKYGR